MLGSDFFQFAGLPPNNCEAAGDGRCSCAPDRIVPLFRKGPERPRCGTCVSLSQYYPHKTQPRGMRLLGFLLITQEQTTYWGNSLPDRVNPRIKCFPQNRVLCGIIMDPPKPPWMLIKFGQAGVSANGPVITEDNDFPCYFDTDHVVSFDRRLVMSLAGMGPSGPEWRKYILASASETPDDMRTIEKMQEKYPGLRDVTALPPVGSMEYIALCIVLKGDDDDV